MEGCLEGTLLIFFSVQSERYLLVYFVCEGCLMCVILCVVHMYILVAKK